MGEVKESGKIVRVGGFQCFSLLVNAFQSFFNAFSMLFTAFPMLSNERRELKFHLCDKRGEKETRHNAIAKFAIPVGRRPVIRQDDSICTHRSLKVNC